MDLAVTGLIPLSIPGVNRGPLQRPQAEQPNQPQTRPDRQAENQNSAGNSTANSERQGRVIRGELTNRSSLDSSRQSNNTQRSLFERELAFSQSGSRQFSVSAAIQAFEDNEALIAPEGQERQVSGIIDEFV